MDYKIPLIRASMPSYDEYCEKIKTIWETKMMSNNGTLHMELEGELKKHLCSEYLYLYANGHLSLEIALKSLQKKGEVITTPFTFISTTQAIVNCGLKPVFCDIDSESMNIDPNKIHELITEKTVAILAVHVFGIPCDVESLEKIAKKYNIALIYDAAHCFGVEINGKGICAFGDMTMMSTHSTKVFNTAEGGILSINNIKYIDISNHMRNFGLTTKEDAKYIGTNAKMSEFHAAMGLCNLAHIGAEIEKRKQISDFYDEMFKNNDAISYIKTKNNIKRNYSYYPIKITNKSLLNRDEVYKKMEENGIQTRKYFYPLTSHFSCYNDKNYCGNTPIAKEISDSILCIPLYSNLTIKEAEIVANTINKLTLGL